MSTISDVSSDVSYSLTKFIVSLINSFWIWEHQQKSLAMLSRSWAGEVSKSVKKEKFVNLFSDNVLKICKKWYLLM